MYEFFEISSFFYNKDGWTPCNSLCQDNWGKPAPERLNPFWILTKQEMMEWKWHQLDHM